MLSEERDLVDRCLEGRETAYCEFVERFQQLVFGLSVRMVVDKHEAEDITQEVFVRAIRGLSGWDRNRPLRPWLLTITANCCKTHLGKRRYRPLLRNADDDVMDPRSLEQPTGELLSEIKGAVGNLRTEYQRVFLLFHEQGLSYEEMSKLTGTPVGTLKTWLHRARKDVMGFLTKKGLIPEIRDDGSGIPRRAR